jgi:hypothetical protein
LTAGTDDGLGIDSFGEIVLPLGKTFTGEEFPLTGSLSGFSNEDEFGFLLQQIETKEALESFIQDILHSFHTPFSIANCDIFI